MKRNLLILSGLVALTLFSGCIVRGTVRARAYGPQPDLVMISPGVYVVADYDDSVFYYDNYYWRYDGYVWYRSNVYTGGWARWSSPPRAIVRIDRPRAARTSSPPPAAPICVCSPTHPCRKCWPSWPPTKSKPSATSCRAPAPWARLDRFTCATPTAIYWKSAVIRSRRSDTRIRHLFAEQALLYRCGN